MGARRSPRRSRTLVRAVTGTTRTARGLALSVISDVRRREAYSPAVLDRALATSALDDRDSALATRLVYGTLGAQGTVDQVINRFAKSPSGIEPSVRDVLRAGTYELLFMRAPAHAVVNEWVALAKRSRPRAAGLVNAVLRRVAESAVGFPWGDPAVDLDALARATAHPRWLVDRLVADHGIEATRSMLESDDDAAPLYLWHDPFRGTYADAFATLAADGAEPEPCFHPGCLVARRPAPAVRGRAVGDGLVLITDAAAQVAPLVVGAHPSEIVVDAAAGRGTKTVQLQALSVAAGGPADLRALDLHEFKTAILARRMDELGVPGVTSAVVDAADPSGAPGVPAPGTAAAVLLDAPCTGTGTLRRHPEKRWRLAPDDIRTMSKLQAHLITGLAPLVRADGSLVYSTCSVMSEENDDVVDGFLASAAGARFRPMDLDRMLPAAWRPYVGRDGRFRSLPSAGGPDGHFVAAFERVD